MNTLFKLSLLGIITISVIVCSENPFFKDDEISATGSEISGRVQLDDQSSPEGVLVWFEGFNLSTFADSQGDFKLTLPPVSSQTGGGVSGLYHIYFYMANYGIDSCQVFTHSGKVTYSKGDINKKGALKSVKTLAKLLRIRTTVTPATIVQNYTGTITINVELIGVSSLVDVQFNKKIGSNDLMGGGFLKKLNDQTVSYIDLTSLQLVTETVSHRTLSLYHELKPATMSVGDYEIIPFVIIKQSHIPEEIFELLGDNVLKLNYEYLTLPMTREGGRFNIMQNF